MAHISKGPVSSMPGAVKAVIEGHTCDTEGHEDRPSFKMVQGETDSFGCEYMDLCEECYKAFLEKPDEKVICTCEWCKAENVEVFPTRDFDEGMYGPVYSVCIACRRKQIEDAEEELEYLQRLNGE